MSKRIAGVTEGVMSSSRSSGSKNKPSVLSGIDGILKQMYIYFNHTCGATGEPACMLMMRRVIGASQVKEEQDDCFLWIGLFQV